VLINTVNLHPLRPLKPDIKHDGMNDSTGVRRS